MFTNTKSRYRNKYLKPDEPLLQTDAVLGKIIQIDGVWYAIVMIGVMWLPDIKILEPNQERCVVAKINPHNGELYDEEPALNVFLTKV